MKKILLPFAKLPVEANRFLHILHGTFPDPFGLLFLTFFLLDFFLFSFNSNIAFSFVLVDVHTSFFFVFQMESCSMTFHPLESAKPSPANMAQNSSLQIFEKLRTYLRYLPYVRNFGSMSHNWRKSPTMVHFCAHM